MKKTTQPIPELQIGDYIVLKKCDPAIVTKILGNEQYEITEEEGDKRTFPLSESDEIWHIYRKDPDPKVYQQERYGNLIWTWMDFSNQNCAPWDDPRQFWR
jgi:hypothetical protein